MTKKRKYKYTGKKFEEDFRKSVPDHIFTHRLKDNAHNWAGVKNICDFFLYKIPILYMLELKTTKGKSLPFSNIAEHQLNGLDEKTHNHKGIVGGFLVNFSELDETYFAFAKDVKDYIFLNSLYFTMEDEDSRKSIPVEWFKYNGIGVGGTKKISRYSFNIDKLINQIETLTKE